MDVIPSMKQLCCEVPNGTIKWKEIATCLDISETDIDRFEVECRGKVKDCFVEVFRAWQMEAKHPFTWGTIITVLQEVGEKRLAEHLQEKYCKNAVP